MLRRLAAYCAVASLYLAARYLVLGRLAIDPGASYFKGRSWLVVWLSMGKYFFTLYFRWLFLGTGMNPACLRPCYGDASAGDILAWVLLGALIVAAALVLLAFVRRPSVPVCGLFFFVIGIVPVSNFFVRIAALAGMRFLYVPSLGACLAAAFFILKVIARPDRSSRTARAAIFSPLALLLVIYSLLIVAGNARFHDEETAYRSILEIAPRSHFAMHNLGATLAKDRRYTEARPILEYVREQAPELDRVHYNLGLIYMEEGRLGQAEESLRMAIALDTGVGMVSDMRVALGNLLEKKGDLRGARDEFLYAAAARYSNTKAHNNLANSYYKECNYPAAERHYRIALQESPDMEEAWQGLGTLLVTTRRYRDAMSEVYDRVLAKPEWQPWAFAGIGRCLMSLGSLQLAEEALRRAVELDRNNLDGLINLSALYLETGRFAESVQTGERALRAGGVDKPEVFYNLALAYEKLNRRQAVVLWKRFLELAHGDPKFIQACEKAKRQLEEQQK
jgi:tetratricopeptide (TPR) repeat protein